MRSPSTSSQRVPVVSALALGIRRLLSESAYALFWWVIVTGLAIGAALYARGAGYHQFLIGLALSAITLLILLSLVEVVWCVVETLAESSRR